ncbi:MAG: hypothetical protein HGA87_02005 [Desulfobulbaceae bacterium]|nr:hypothetical protein [Desulfobulbaceae bacterium]
MKTYCLDTNCLIDAFQLESHSYKAMEKILGAYRAGDLRLVISRHSLSELLSPPEAVEFAKTLQIIEHYPVGNWEEQICTWKQCAGTWDYARRNTDKLKRIEMLAQKVAGIRDKGAYIDAIITGVAAFVTSDKALVGLRPAEDIYKEFGIMVIDPEKLASILLKKDY